MKNVFIAGGLSLDFIIQVGSLPEPKSQTVFSKKAYNMIGSTGAGKVLNISRLGFNTVFHAMIGNDEKGNYIKKEFEKENFKFIYDIDPKGTESHTNIMADDGKRISIYTDYATFEPQINMQILEKEIKKSDILILNIINYVRDLIPLAKKYNKEIWCDIHDFDGENEYHQDFIDGADYILMSSDGMEDYIKYAESLIKKGKKLVICTHGKDGASVIDENLKWYFEPIIKDYERIDTNGAGDSFFVGFLYAHKKGYDIKKCLRYGTILGGLTINSDLLYNENLNEEFLENEYKKYYGDD